MIDIVCFPRQTSKHVISKQVEPCTYNAHTCMHVPPLALFIMPEEDARYSVVCHWMYTTEYFASHMTMCAAMIKKPTDSITKSFKE